MKETEKFYNEKESKRLTYLEFGSINTSEGGKTVWDFRLHQEAYDFFMMARYMKDLMAYRWLRKKSKDLSWAEQLDYYEKNIYTQDFFNSFGKLAALHIASSTPTYLELGSTLMGCIEALEYLQAIGARCGKDFSDLDLGRTSFYGIDISHLLNEVAVAIHPGHQTLTFLEQNEIAGEVDLLFAKGVSLLYATRTTDELLRLFEKSRVSYFDLSFALGKPQERYLGTGKKVTYTSIDAFLIRTKKLGKKLFIQEGNAMLDKKTLRANFYFGDPDVVSRILKEEQRLRQAVSDALRDEEKKTLFLGPLVSDNDSSDFILAEDYLAKHL